MTNRNKEKGTAAETAVVRYFIARGYTGAERRSLRGVNDGGDIAGVPMTTIEVKAEKNPPARPDGWFNELLREMRNTGDPIGILVVKVPYKPVERWDAWMPYRQIAGNLSDGAFDTGEAWTWVRMDLRMAVEVLENLVYRYR